jgi:hypothetical protein
MNDNDVSLRRTGDGRWTASHEPTGQRVSAETRRGALRDLAETVGSAPVGADPVEPGPEDAGGYPAPDQSFPRF